MKNLEAIFISLPGSSVSKHLVRENFFVGDYIFISAVLGAKAGVTNLFLVNTIWNLTLDSFYSSELKLGSDLQ